MTAAVRSSKSPARRRAHSDGDGVPNGSANGTNNPNAEQRDDDGDGIGDACDALNANYQAAIAEHTCWTAIVTNLRPNTTVIEDRVEHREHDVSSRGALIAG